MFQTTFTNIFRRLPPAFYTAMAPEGFAKDPFLIAFNKKAAALIDMTISPLALRPITNEHKKFVAYFSGQEILPGSDPLAMVYGGHQFGVWVPQLGDGRALLLGQLQNKKGQWFDIQLKGSGITPYSRFADGRAVLRSTIREYLGSEMMAGLGIATSRALCIIGTGQMVRRETWEAGAVLTRLATTHIRFGSVEYFAHNNRAELIPTLLNHVIAHYVPSLKNSKQPYHDLLTFITDQTAKMIAAWQAVGFCHGVMNTDNMSILGETIDYGPFGFLEEYNPDHICNHSDEAGRYRFQNQPSIAWWNLYALNVALRTLVPEAEGDAIVKNFATLFEQYFFTAMANKLGLMHDHKIDSDKNLTRNQLIKNWLDLLEQQKADYTHSHFLLTHDWQDLATAPLFQNATGQQWLTDYKQLCGVTHNISNDKERSALARQHNPPFILRNWVAQKVIEEAEQGRYDMIDDVLAMCQNPFAVDLNHEFCQPAPAAYRHLAVSCSS